MDNTVTVDQVLIPNSLAIAKRLLNKNTFKRVKAASDIVATKVKGNLKAQEYYGASAKKLAFVLYNKKLISRTPRLFNSVSRIENCFNTMVLMARGCLDSLACTINLVYGDKLKETNVRPLESEFLKTIHHKSLKEILTGVREKWLDIDEYRNLVIHRTSVLILPSGSDPNKIEYFSVVKNPSEFISSIATQDFKKHVVRLDQKVNEITQITEKTFIEISSSFNQDN